MFERFSQGSIKVIMLAQDEARRMGHNYVGTEQILLGLAGEKEGVAATALQSAGISQSEIRTEVEKLTGRGSGFVAVEIPFTARARQTLEAALQCSTASGSSVVDTEHLLSGLLNIADCTAVKALLALNVQVADLTASLQEQVNKGAPARIFLQTLNPALTVIQSLSTMIAGAEQHLGSIQKQLNTEPPQPCLKEREIQLSLERLKEDLEVLERLLESYPEKLRGQIDTLQKDLDRHLPSEGI